MVLGQSTYRVKLPTPPALRGATAVQTLHAVVGLPPYTKACTTVMTCWVACACARYSLFLMSSDRVNHDGAAKNIGGREREARA